MRVERKPKIGDTMFHVCEHFYYVPEHAAPLNEYLSLIHISEPTRRS